MHEKFSLAGKHAIVTGGTRGIGLAVAKGFAEAGAKVTICGRKDEGVQEALTTLGALGESVHGVAAHVGKDDGVVQLVESAESAFGPVQILVNNAGTNPYYGPIMESEDWAWDKTMGVNLRASYVLSKTLGQKMIEAGGGSIVNVSSIAGLQALPNQGIYSVTKAALIMLTKVMAREMGQYKVRVNCICPGLIQTRLSQAMWENERALKATLKQKALGRMGDPDELVGAAIYLASEASSFTTGSVLQIDGGMVI